MELLSGYRIHIQAFSKLRYIITIESIHTAGAVSSSVLSDEVYDKAKSGNGIVWPLAGTCITETSEISHVGA